VAASIEIDLDPRSGKQSSPLPSFFVVFHRISSLFAGTVGREQPAWRAPPGSFATLPACSQSDRLRIAATGYLAPSRMRRLDTAAIWAAKMWAVENNPCDCSIFGARPILPLGGFRMLVLPFGVMVLWCVSTLLGAE